MKDEKLAGGGEYNIAKCSFLGSSTRTTLTFLHGINMWPIANEHLNTSIRYLVGLFCKYAM